MKKKSNEQDTDEEEDADDSAAQKKKNAKIKSGKFLTKEQREAIKALNEETYRVCMSLEQFLADGPLKEQLSRIIMDTVKRRSDFGKLASLYINHLLNRLVDNATHRGTLADYRAVRSEFLQHFNPRKYLDKIKLDRNGNPKPLHDAEFALLLDDNGIEGGIDLSHTGNLFSALCNKCEENFRTNVRTHEARHIAKRYFKEYLSQTTLRPIQATKQEIEATMEYLLDENSTIDPNVELLDRRYLSDLQPLIPPYDDDVSSHDDGRTIKTLNADRAYDTTVHQIPRGWLSRLEWTSVKALQAKKMREAAAANAISAKDKKKAKPKAKAKPQWYWYRHA